MSELKAGRELDALIAEKVMGWKRGPKRQYIEGENWLLPDGASPHYREGAVGGLKAIIPSFSTDIAAAFEVFEKLAEQFADVGVHALSRGFWEAEIYDESKAEWIRASARTAPLAICLAALKAVEVVHA